MLKDKNYSDITTDNSQEELVTVRLAENSAEIEEAQRLRYKVFYEEYGAVANDIMRNSRMDMDEYDEFADHLVVVDNSQRTNCRYISFIAA